MLSISFIIGQLNVPVAQMLDFMRGFQDASLSMKRVNEIYHKDEEEQGEEITDNIASITKEDIELQDVSFKYDNSRHSPLIIDKATFRLPAGKLTALVGGSGSGKTTIMKMLLKFYDPSMGKITIGNTDLSKISPEAWRSRCGVVMQEG